jgi:hypothetical protein
MQKTISLELARSGNLGHHLSQARAWLDVSDDGKHAVPLCYAAFEIRLFVERICMQYYATLVGLKTDPYTLGYFDRMKNEIFNLAGHQKTIDQQFEFARAMLKILKIPASMPTPNLGRLSAIWHDCSDPCHIFWNMAAATGVEYPKYDPFSDLTGYASELDVYVGATAYWMQTSDARLDDIRARFKGGADGEEELRKYFAKTGLNAEFVPTEGAMPQPVGTPIPRDEEISEKNA